MDAKATQSDIDVRYVAWLARLALTEEEARGFQGQLAAIVGYVRKISELDVSGVEPTAHAMPVENVFREDAVVPGLDRDTVLALAPESRDGQFVVPRIVE